MNRENTPVDGGTRVRDARIAGAAGKWAQVIAFFRSSIREPYVEQLRAEQRDAMLNRCILLIWVGVFGMPATIVPYVAAQDPTKMQTALALVSIAVALSFVLRFLIVKGVFAKHFHLPVLILVGGIFGYAASTTLELTHATAGNAFFFAYFMICSSFFSYFVADLSWLLTTCGVIIASHVAGHFFRPGGFSFDSELTTNIIYLVIMTEIGVVLNRSLCKLFFDEKISRIELAKARDALLDEMDIARRIQTVLLPKKPQLAEHSVHGTMLPAVEVGGDYYDIIETSSGRQFIAIGDVSGHGVTSGLAMMMVRSSLLTTLEASPRASLIDIYHSMNHCLRQSLLRMDVGMYMTFGLFEHTGSGHFRGIGAHPPPLLFRASTKAVEEIKLPGVWLGLFDRIPAEACPEVAFHLHPGDTLLLYTDGIVERAEPRSKEMFGVRRLHEALVAHAGEHVESVVKAIVTMLDAYSSLQDDDVTLVALRYDGQSVASDDGRLLRSTTARGPSM